MKTIPDLCIGLAVRSYRSCCGFIPMRYYDQVDNAWRFKRRYVWAFWSALLSLSVGVTLGATLFR
ncbi:MAG: hypothetical protein ACREVL_19265 [Solimonas sp.]